MFSVPLPEQNPSAENMDGENLERLGYQQELKRNFSFTSMLSLAVSLMATWESLCSTMTAGLVSGGPVSLVYGAVLAFLGTLCSAMSLAELASAYPTAGGQYHFVAKLAPQSTRAVASWFQGLISTLGWIAVAGSAPFLAGTMIQGLLVLNYPESYTYERWHGTILYWATLIFGACISIYGSHILPLVEKLTLVLHLGLFIIIVVVMCAASPSKNSAAFVFTDLENSSGWSSDGIAWCVGMLSSCYSMIGYDGATHLSEEMLNSTTGVPNAMVGSVVLNGMMGFGFLIALLFCMGDIAAALSTETGYPIIEIFYYITGNNRAASALTSAIIFMAILATIPLITSAARVMWSFARDQGLPFSRFLASVEEKRGIPTVSVVVTTVMLMLIGLINIGSTTAFNAILSLAVIGLQTSYVAAILLMLWRRTTSPRTVEYGPWRLAKAGVPVNIVAVLYLVFTSIFSVFPPYQPITTENMNYGSVVFGGTVLLGVVYWIFRARKRYAGPLIVIDARDVPETSDGLGLPTKQDRSKQFSEVSR